eukprot:314561_1
MAQEFSQLIIALASYYDDIDKKMDKTIVVMEEASSNWANYPHAHYKNPPEEYCTENENRCTQLRQMKIKLKYSAKLSDRGQFIEKLQKMRDAEDEERGYCQTRLKHGFSEDKYWSTGYEKALKARGCLDELIELLKVQFEL